MAVTQIDGARQLRFTDNLDLETNRIINVVDPSGDQDAATKAYVDAQVAGGVVDFKESVRVATTAAGTLANSFENGDTIDGVTLSTNDRILIKDQSSGSENGIYIVNSSGAPTRAGDADGDAEVTADMFCFVEEGTANADTGWILTTNNPITVGVTSLTFQKFADVNSSGIDDMTAGQGLVKSADLVDVELTSSGGLQFTGAAPNGTLGIDLDTNSGLALGAGGISIGDGSGLVASGGTLAVDLEAAGTGTGGLVFDNGEIRINIDSTSGLLLDSGGLTVDAGLGITVDSTSSGVAIQLDGTTLEVSGSGVKLFDGTSAHILIGQGIGTDSTYFAVSGDVSMDNTGQFTISNSFITSSWVTREVPSGTIDGSNSDFTSANAILSNTEEVFLNGVLQNVGSGNDYTKADSTTIGFLAPPESGDVILINYATDGTGI